MAKTNHLFTFLFILLSIGGFCQKKVNVNDVQEQLGNGLYFFVDSSNKMDVHQVKNLFEHNKFSPVKSKVYQAGYSDATHWLAINLVNETSQVADLIYQAKDPTSDEVELFQCNDSGIISLGTTGDLKPFAERPILDKNFVFAIAVPAKRTSTFLLRIANHGHTNFIPIDIQPKEIFRESSVKEYLLWGILSGVILFVALFAIFIFISLKDRLYFFYALYVLCMLVWIWSNNGLGNQFIWGKYPWIMGRTRFISVGLMMILSLQIMQLFLGQTKHNSIFFKYAVVIKWAFLCFLLMALVPYDFSKSNRFFSSFLIIVDILSLGGVVVLYGSGIEKIRQGLKSATYYMIAIVFVTLGGASLFLLRLKILEANNITMNLIYVGIVTEIVVLTFGLTIRYNNYKKEKEKLLLEMKENEKESAIKMALAKEEERKRIAADMHDDLGAGLSGLRLMSELATRKNTIEEFKKETLRIASSATDLSEKMKDVIWTLNSENDSLQGLLFYIHQYGVELFENAEMPFIMQLPQSITEYAITGDWRRHLFLAVKEAFNNIIKHAGASLVECKIDIGSELKIEVKDNGKGFSKNNSKTGNGLGNMQQRMNSINGQLKVESNDGTMLVFIIPLPNSFANP